MGLSFQRGEHRRRGEGGGGLGEIAVLKFQSSEAGGEVRERVGGLDVSAR
jgi:hypothetical protein